MSHEHALKDLRFSAAILGIIFTLQGLADFSKQFYLGTALGLFAGFVQIITAIRANEALKELKNDNS